MRIAAGILLILVSIFNVIGGVKDMAVGAVGEYASAHQADINSALAAPKTAGGDKAAAKAAADAQAAAAKLASNGAGTKYFGYFLLAFAVAQFIAAIFAFIKKGAMFLLIVAVLTIATEIIAMFLGTGFSVMAIVFAIPGLLAGVLLFLAANGMRKPAGAAAAPPPAPAV